MTGLRTASLGMYDRPEIRWANDRIWAALAAWLRMAGMAGVPDGLDRGRTPAAGWDDPALLFGQCCGYPLMTAYRARLRIVAIPSYTADGCGEGAYRSRIMVRADDPAGALSELRGRRAAVNDRQSNSGANVFRAAVAPLAGGSPFFAGVIETGSHDASVAALIDGRADVAAIDAVSFAHLARHAPDRAAQVRTIGWSVATAALPFVTSARTSDADLLLLRRALRAVVADPALSAARAALLLDGVGAGGMTRYRAIPALERQAERAGYPVLA